MTTSRWDHRHGLVRLPHLVFCAYGAAASDASVVVTTLGASAVHICDACSAAVALHPVSQWHSWQRLQVNWLAIIAYCHLHIDSILQVISM